VESSLVECQYDEERQENLYSLHRLVIEFLQTQHQQELPRLFHCVYQFYQSEKSVKKPKTLEDLRPVLEAQHLAFHLGNYHEASEILYYQLDDYLYLWGYWDLLKDLWKQIMPELKIGYDKKWRFFWQRIGMIHRNTGNWDEAEKYFRKSLENAQKVNSKRGMASSWGLLGDIERNRGNWDEAERLYRQSLALRTELGDRSGMATSWGVLGDIERNRGNWDEAERLYRQSLALRTELGDKSGMAAVWGCLGENELGQGNLDAAEKYLTEALAQMKELGMTWHIAEANFDLAQLWRKRGNEAIAQQHYQKSHQIFQQLGAIKDLEQIEQEFN